MTTHISDHCIEHARTALEAYALATRDVLVDETTVSDLVGDLAHFCRAQAFDPLHAFAHGLRHWAFEEKDPDGLAPLPEVVITVTPAV